VKRDIGIVFIVLLAIVLGGLAGALAGRSGSEDTSVAVAGQTDAINSIVKRIEDIEERLDALESSPTRFSTEDEIEGKLRSISDRLQRLERAGISQGQTGSLARPGLKPAVPAPPVPAVARASEPSPASGADKRREIMEKQYEYRKQHVDRQIKMIADLVKRGNDPLSESQIESLKQIMQDTLNRKKDIELLILDDPERARERTEEFKQLEEQEEEAARGLLSDEQFKAYQRYVRRGGPSGWNRRGGRRDRR
jgi:hypothetical protein